MTQEAQVHHACAMRLFFCGPHFGFRSDRTQKDQRARVGLSKRSPCVPPWSMIVVIINNNSFNHRHHHHFFINLCVSPIAILYASQPRRAARSNLPNIFKYRSWKLEPIYAKTFSLLERFRLRLKNELESIHISNGVVFLIQPSNQLPSTYIHVQFFESHLPALFVRKSLILYDLNYMFVSI